MKINMPNPTGEYAVGTFTFTVYNDRKETLDAEKEKMRSIASRVYYPVEKSSVEGLPKCRNLSCEMTKAIRKAFLVPISFKGIEKKGLNKSNCYENVPAIKDKKFPLIFFSHGYRSFREANSFLCIELASHGYVVISVAHPHEALLTEFDDGTFINYDKKLTRKMYSPFIRGVREVLKLTKSKGNEKELAEKFDQCQKTYIRFLMDRIPEWEKDTEAVLKYARENLCGMIDFEKGIGATGHSMGGAVAYSLCQDNADFSCGINIDGGLFGNHDGKILDKPFLQINCEMNQNVVTRGYLYHKKPVYKVVLKDMRHLGFSDMKYMIPLKSQVGKLSPDIAHEITCTCHLEFFDAYLKNKKSEPNLPSNENVQSKKYEADV